jgi:hypothetical protein
MIPPIDQSKLPPFGGANGRNPLGGGLGGMGGSI